MPGKYLCPDGQKAQLGSYNVSVPDSGSSSKTV